MQRIARFFFAVALIFISSVISINANQGIGLTALYNGVNVRNNLALCLSDFVIIAITVFNNLGKCEQYLFGYGKYCLVRHKKRDLLLINILFKSIGFCVIIVFLRTIVFLLIAIFSTGLEFINYNSLVNFIFINITTLFHLTCIQIVLELSISSFVGLVSSLFYYIISVFLGGTLISNEIYFPLLFMTPNFYMKTRSDLLCEALGLNLINLYIILYSYILLLTITSKLIIKKKDIF